MPSPQKCTLCEKNTSRIVRTRGLDFIFLCGNHKEQIETDKTILRENKQKTAKYYFERQEKKLPEKVIEIMVNETGKTSNRELFQTYQTKGTIEVITEEKLEQEYKKFKESRGIPNAIQESKTES